MSSQLSDEERFGYPKSISVFLILIGALFAVLCCRSVIEIGHINKTSFAGMLSSLAFIFSAIYLSTYVLQVTRSQISVRTLFGCKVVPFTTVQSVVIYYGLKTNWIQLQRGGGGPLVVKDSIGPYQLLCRKILSSIPSGISVIQRDRFGKETPYSAEEGKF